MNALYEDRAAAIKSIYSSQDCNKVLTPASPGLPAKNYFLWLFINGLLNDLATNQSNSEGYVFMTVI